MEPVYDAVREDALKTVCATVRSTEDPYYGQMGMVSAWSVPQNNPTWQQHIWFHLNFENSVF